MGILTTMYSEAKDTIHERHITEYYILCKTLIKEMVPEIVKQEMANTESDLWVRIQTQLNGKDIDFPEIREYIRQMIEEELRKMVREIRL